MSQYPKTEISPLLHSIVEDNPTYDFPVDSIRDELIQLYMNQLEFEYFMMQGYKKLKKQYHIVFANIFLTTLEQVMDTVGNDPHILEHDVYQSKIDYFISVLETLKVTRIEKNSPDGEILSAMI
jgi:hypothetical protein